MIGYSSGCCRVSIAFKSPVFRRGRAKRALPRSLIGCRCLYYASRRVFASRRRSSFIPCPIYSSGSLRCCQVGNLCCRAFSRGRVCRGVGAKVRRKRRVFTVHFSRGTICRVTGRAVVGGLVPRTTRFLMSFERLRRMGCACTISSEGQVVVVF